MIFDILMLAGGFACAAGGGELFVRGAVALSRSLRVPASVIGVTVAAFATSSPELAVAVRSALGGTPEVAFGDSTGSNVVNVGLILGLGLLISPIHCPASSIRRDIPLASGVAAALSILAWDGTISRLDGCFLLCGFVAWLTAVTREALQSRTVIPADENHRLSIGAVSIRLLPGLVLLVAAGQLVVTGAVRLGAALGFSSFVVGATLVAVGTSMPELAATVVAQARHEEQIGLGNILGSNIFNALFILGTAAVIHPIRVASSQAIGALTFAFVLPLLVWPGRRSRVGRWRGLLLLALYALYLALLIRPDPGTFRETTSPKSGCGVSVAHPLHGKPATRADGSDSGGSMTRGRLTPAPTKSADRESSTVAAQLVAQKVRVLQAVRTTR